MEKKSSKKGDIKISLLGLLIGISLIVAGVYGIVSNKIENQEYKNSTDIRTVNAVVEECRRKDEKNDADILIRSEYNFRTRFAEAMKFQLKFIAHQRAAIRLSPTMILLLFYFAAWRFLLAQLLL